MVQALIVKIFRIEKYIRYLLATFMSKLICSFYFYVRGVQIGSFKSAGVPYVYKSFSARIVIGDRFTMNNGVRYSGLGINGKCRIEVRDTAQLVIGNNVGMSDVTITCHEKITIGNNVLLGVGAVVRDSDSHSLNPQDRLIGLDWKNKQTAPIVIKDNVFVGMNTIILKGVTIGENSVVGAGSVVSRDIPDNEVWAGNPARFLKRLDEKTLSRKN